MYSGWCRKHSEQWNGNKKQNLGQGIFKSPNVLDNNSYKALTLALLELLGHKIQTIRRGKGSPSMGSIPSFLLVSSRLRWLVCCLHGLFWAAENHSAGDYWKWDTCQNRLERGQINWNLRERRQRCFWLFERQGKDGIILPLKTQVCSLGCSWIHL